MATPERLHYADLPAFIRRELQARLVDIFSLDDLVPILEMILARARVASGSIKLGYVSGIISCDGPEKIPENLAKLRKQVKEIQPEFGFPIFSSACVFYGDEVYRAVARKGPITNEDEYRNFWCKVLECGFISDIIMMKRWEESIGAKREKVCSEKLGIVVHFHVGV